MTEKQAVLSERDSFLNHLKNIVDITKNNKTEIVIVGGIALRSIMNKEVEFRRPNGTIPDVDAIALGPNFQNITKTIKDLNKYQKSFKNCPSVGLEPVDFSNEPRKNYSPLEMVSGIRKDDNGRYFLTFRSVEQEISPLTMLPITRQYGGVEIPTLDKDILWQRYYIRVGFLKPKDVDKIDLFRSYINNHGSDQLDPTLIIPYVDFYEKMNKKHPTIIKITKTYWNIDQKLGGKISGANGLIYSLISKIRR